MRLVDGLGSDLAVGGDGSVNAVGAVHQMEGDTGDGGLHGLGGGLQGQGLAGAQDGGLRLGNGDALSQQTDLNLHGSGLLAAVVRGSGDGHGAGAGHIPGGAVLNGEHLGVGRLPGDAFLAVGGIELRGESKLSALGAVQVQSLAGDVLVATVDLD